jgi:isoleucyl-tRNA synthetase
MPELECWVLHRLAEMDFQIRTAVETHDWTGVYASLHTFCATDLSAFYFDIRKDALYCDRPDSLRRRAARTVLDHLHRCLTTWLAPVLAFTAEEAWCARFGEETSVHLQDFPDIPEAWRDDALGARWGEIRDIRRVITGALERARADGTIGAALQAAPVLHLPPENATLLKAGEWAELAIVSALSVSTAPPPDNASTLPEVPNVAVVFAPAAGDKCARCWRVLPEVGQTTAHPALCRRCADAVASGLSYRRAAE